MQYTLSTVSAFVAALSLASAAPMPSAGASQDVIIVRQLAGFDEASTITAKLDATTINDRSVKSAAVSSLGPWCAGFTDSKATQPAKALNGDGIFNSQNPAVYAPEGSSIEIGSWWCGATRPEVENFVKNALVGGSKDNKDTTAPVQPINNGANNGGNVPAPAEPVNNGEAPVTVRVEVQTDTAGTTFFQEELPANVGVQSASTTRTLGRVAKVTVVGSGSGDCSFIDANGLAINFGTGSELIDVVAFVCEA